MNEFIDASNFSENLISRSYNDKNSHKKESPLIVRNNSSVILPSKMGSRFCLLTNNKGYRTCSICSKNCAYRSCDHTIDGEFIYMNHCMSRNIYFFTRG